MFFLSPWLLLALVLLLLYLNFGNLVESLIVLCSVPFALVVSVWLMAMMGYNLSTAVWVGIIALAGVAAETSAVMLAYLDEACKRRKAAGQLNSLADLLDTVHQGALERIRPMASRTSLTASLVFFSRLNSTETFAEPSVMDA